MRPIVSIGIRSFLLSALFFSYPLSLSLFLSFLSLLSVSLFLSLSISFSFSFATSLSLTLLSLFSSPRRRFPPFGPSSPRYQGRVFLFGPRYRVILVDHDTQRAVESRLSVARQGVAREKRALVRCVNAGSPSNGGRTASGARHPHAFPRRTVYPISVSTFLYAQLIRATNRG